MPNTVAQPTSIKAPLGQPWFEMTWSDGSSMRIPNRVLRGYCPCAGCQGHGGSITYVTGHDEDLRDIEPVGNYALRLVWGDGHGSGLYSFAYLKKLGNLYAEHGDALSTIHPILPR